MDGRTGPRRASNRFLQVYDALPPDAQQLLVHRQLVPLLDSAPKDRQISLIASATDLHRRYARMPALNLSAKKAEIAALLLELSRDSKRALVKQRSRREQLLSEAVVSLAQWLNDIWKVVFEFRTNFSQAHTCLLFACDALDRIGNGCGGCKCSYASMFIPIKIRRSTGKLVKSFMLNGAHNLESVMLWIWRDLFIAILATGSTHQRSTVLDMMHDIRVLLGWRALELLLHGGTHRTSSHPSSPASLTSPRACCEADVEDHLSERELEASDDGLNTIDDDADQDCISDDCSVTRDEELYPRSLYAAHWSWRITSQQQRLRDLVHNALLDIFKVSPSEPLYSSMVAIAEDEDALEEELHPLVMSAAGHSSENFSAALRILSLNHRADSVNEVLKAHKHLLRPQDAASLQFAVLVLSSNFYYRAHAISIVEEELLDVSNVFRAAIRFSFCNIGFDSNKTELTRILALPHSTTRRARVERWVEGILTPQADTAHPMALAALMIGIPLPPGVDGTDEGDMLGYFEVEGDDPEVDNLREEFRPDIKTRLQGWVDTAVALKGGSALLIKVYSKVTVDMPFLTAKDVVEEMSARIADRPSKMHAVDALQAFGAFCEKQRVKVAAAKAKAARTKVASTSRASALSSASTSSKLDPTEDVD